MRFKHRTTRFRDSLAAWMPRKLDETDVYARHPINQNRDEIRLLKIYPGKWEDSLNCSMLTTPLAKAPGYKTLSYVWGAMAPQYTIHIDGLKFSIGPNLHAALLRLRAHSPYAPVFLWADYINIDQTKTFERNQQVGLMGKIYSQAEEVIVWFGELDDVEEKCFKYTMEDASETLSHGNHPSNCQCKQQEWTESMSTPFNMSASRLAIEAAPALLRLATVQKCTDYLACELFDSFDQMIAVRYVSLPGAIAEKKLFDLYYQVLYHCLTDNSWFFRMWTVQEILLARKGTFLLGPVSFPIDVLFEMSAIWDVHVKNACCQRWMDPLGPAIGPLVKRCFFLGRNRDLLKQGQRPDLFALRIEYPDRKASLDYDLIYGLLGLSDKTYDVFPDYNRSVEDVYTEASKNYLAAHPKFRSFWLFVYAPLKHRYPNLPSWVMDWTSLEDGDYQNSRYTWTGLQTQFEQPYDFGRPREYNNFRNVRFAGNTMVMHAQYIDSITAVGDGVDSLNPVRWLERYWNAIKMWRRMVLAKHSPTDVYRRPQGYQAGADTWASAWIKVMTAGHRPDKGRNIVKQSEDDAYCLEHDAELDINSLLLLDPSTQFRATDSPKPRMNQQMYQKVATFLPSVLEGKRMIMTQFDYLGFGNVATEVGDEIWLPSTCIAPLILRPVRNSLLNTGRQTYTIVSVGYLQGFMDGPLMRLNVPDEELWIV